MKQRWYWFHCAALSSLLVVLAIASLRGAEEISGGRMSPVRGSRLNPVQGLVLLPISLSVIGYCIYRGFRPNHRPKDE